MPPPTSRAAVDLALDIQALRHLVTRRRIADVLWSGKVRKALTEALREVHGENDFYYLERSVSKQLLLTHANLLPSLVERLYEENNDRRAQQILGIVDEIMHANRQDSTSIQFQEEFVLLLLQALLQASLQILMQAESDDIGPIYRTTVDLIRALQESCGDSVPALSLKRLGIKLVKDVVTDLTKSDKKGALLKATDFLQSYSNTRTASNLQAQINVLEKDLGPLLIRQNYERSRAGHRLRERRKRKRRVPDDEPDFFSDGSDETSNVTPDESPRDARVAAPEVLVAGLGSEVDSQSSAGTPKPPKKRSRMSREVADDAATESVRLENGDMPTRSETPVSKSRGKRYPDLGQLLNAMDSPMFSETRPAPEEVDHVVRHARSRGQDRTWRPRGARKRVQPRQRSPTSISQEGSSPTHRGARTREAGDLFDYRRYVRKGIDKDDEDAMGRMGKEGAILHDLHTKATKLQAAGPSDPLPEAIEDARQAKHRRYVSDPSYSPGVEARDASPFPDSDDDSDLTRKKVSRLQLVQTPVGKRSKRERRPAVSKPVILFGKTCRSGRFEPFEDKLLLKGLTALGWGAWTEIAREFWEGEFTRAPSSLKDRARTLGLMPTIYPRRIELRGRPRLADNPGSSEKPPLQGRGGSGSDDDEDRDEDEEDPIEAPNGTPGSGIED